MTEGLLDTSVFIASEPGRPVHAAAMQGSGRRLPVNDSWIAATAIAHQMPVVTQDGDHEGLPGLSVIRV